jgi:translation initiation factor 3 subunit M
MKAIIMSSSDSIAVFSEGTFQVHILDLASYAAQSLPEEERAPFAQKYEELTQDKDGQKPIAADEDRQRAVFSNFITDVMDLGADSELEVEGFFNLIYTQLFMLYPAAEDARVHLNKILSIVSSSTSKSTSLKYRIVSNFLASVPADSPLRLPVYRALLALSVQEGELDTLRPSVSDIEKSLAQWRVSDEEKSDLLKSIADAYSQVSQPDLSYQFLLSYVRSIPASSPSAQNAGLEAVAAALRQPSVFDFDPLFKLDAIIALKGHPLFALLQIFMNHGLTEYQSWAASNSSSLDEYKIDNVQLERKIRLLTLASLAFSHIGKELSYSQIATALQVQTNQVEKWFIDAIRVGLVSGKLSQTAQTVHVTRSTARVFERAQWESLEKRLQAWKTGLAGVLEVVGVARRQGMGHVNAQVQNATA